jgi:hypothetical protein
MSDRTGLSRGDRNRNARLARLRQLRQEPRVSSKLQQHSRGRRVSRPEYSHPMGAGLADPHLAADTERGPDWPM